ncbi:hypothetical protein QOT17_024990 [Balamuthia mandrillaris]
MEDQCQKKAHKLQQQSFPATSATPALSSASTTRNPNTAATNMRATTSTPVLSQLISFLNSNNVPAPAAEQQDSIRDEEEYNEFYESQQALNSITVLVESNLRKERVGDETRSVFKRIEEGQ